MNFKINLRLTLGLLWLIHHGGAASLSDVDSEEEFMPPAYPQPRIVGGSNAYEGQFPYQVSLRLRGVHDCGGSIISSNYIVTAAHCVASLSPPSVKPVSELSVRVGSRLQSSGGEIVEISEVIIHPDYSAFHNDIALLRLSRPLEFNERVQAIALASHDPPSGVPVLASGWGRLSTNGFHPEILQYTYLLSATYTDCRRVMPISESVICMGHPTFNSGACKGDSGGPAVYNSTLVGVFNFMDGGCGGYYPDGYASVAHFHDWLKDNSDV